MNKRAFACSFVQRKMTAQTQASARSLLSAKEKIASDVRLHKMRARGWWRRLCSSHTRCAHRIRTHAAAAVAVAAAAALLVATMFCACECAVKSAHRARALALHRSDDEAHITVALASSSSSLLLLPFGFYHFHVSLALKTRFLLPTFRFKHIYKAQINVLALASLATRSSEKF